MEHCLKETKKKIIDNISMVLHEMGTNTFVELKEMRILFLLLEEERLENETMTFRLLKITVI